MLEIINLEHVNDRIAFFPIKILLYTHPYRANVTVQCQASVYDQTHTGHGTVLDGLSAPLKYLSNHIAVN
jgi:hypothetical protein